MQFQLHRSDRYSQNSGSIYDRVSEILGFSFNRQFARYRVTLYSGQRRESIFPSLEATLLRSGMRPPEIILRCSVINFFLLRELHTPKTHPSWIQRGSVVRVRFDRTTLLCHLQLIDQRRAGEKNTRASTPPRARISSVIEFVLDYRWSHLPGNTIFSLRSSPFLVGANKITGEQRRCEQFVSR